MSKELSKQKTQIKNTYTAYVYCLYNQCVYFVFVLSPNKKLNREIGSNNSGLIRYNLSSLIATDILSSVIICIMFVIY